GDHQRSVFERRDRRHGIRVRTDLHLAGESRVARGGSGPAVAGSRDPRDGESLLGADDDLVLHGTDLEHEARLAIGSGTTDVEALALADREGVRTLVGAEHL